MADGEKNVKVNLAFELDQGTANKVSAAIEAMSQKAKKQAKGTTSEGAQNVLESLGKLQQMGLIITGAATGLNAAMLMSARSYVSNVTTGEQASRRWLGASKSLEQSQMRIGRSITEAVVPALETAAGLAEKFSKFSETREGKALVTTGVTAVSGAMIGGAALTGIAGVANAIGTISKTFGEGGALAGLGKLLGGLGPVLKMAGAVGGGVALGNLYYDTFRDKSKTQSAGAIEGQALTIIAASLGNLFGKAPEWGMAMGKLTGAIQDTGDAAQKSSTELDATAGQIAAYLSYQRQTQEANRSYNRQLFTTNRDFQRQMTLAEEDYLKGRTRSMRDFARNEHNTEMDYYRQRRIAARDFNIQIQRQEYDHQKELRRSREDHEFALKRIIMEGDGMAFWEENRQYNLQRSRGEEDFNLQLSRQNEDFARQRADQEQEYAIQRARRLQEFEIQRKDQEIDYQIQRKRAQEQHAIQLRDMQYQFDEERRLRLQGLIDQLRDQKGALEQERIMRMEFNQAMLNDLARAQQMAEKGTNLLLSGSRQVGGYLGPGIYKTHKKEFMMNPETTGAAERILGESLNQNNLLAAIAGSGRGRMGSFIYQDNRVFSRGLSPEEKSEIRRDTENILNEVISGTAL